MLLPDIILQPYANLHCSWQIIMIIIIMEYDGCVGSLSCVLLVNHSFKDHTFMIIWVNLALYLRNKDSGLNLVYLKANKLSFYLFFYVYVFLSLWE